MKDPMSKRLSVLGSKHCPLRPINKRASAFYDVFVAGGRRHMHSVHIYFREEWCWHRDDRGYHDMLCFADLTDVACKNEPGDVLGHMRPPISFGNECICCEEAMMTDVIVCDGD